MADPEEEQAAELEALEAIYADDFQRQEGLQPARFSIKMTNEDGDVHVQLTIEYTADYPNELPMINLQPLSNIAKDKTESITKVLRQEAEDNVGAVMVFSLVSKTQECLAEMPDTSAKADDDESGSGLRKPKVDDSAAIRHGTLVTRENFLEWHEKFEIERKSWGEAKRVARAKEAELKKDRLTGRQFFTKMAAANASIDWDLFNADDEDLDDMDFDEDEAEDAD
jgi:hypothetical protein|mmetsp:Transcript_34887/g.58349  ORF Transcript_34887/g.58349 Transcript_34887/m.58349 type:complete len:225 (-) Transcript_34887:440-1114(-)|eukprot:CAMPEP_0174292658 /NCGR_PEP_ID=MMETSP0809-20121228/36144_1 /TAXON_ID=73025 ORGANISM="Eutreptiella gymnastica-like, Strain CCMP1594" /NCGR_SAMPLE_ID=MMETSP0809 /ASSEMBLY_ACC=CAM_ASM_000658 /LENGTH=224 /DNA_ID=CAMNT_0015392883 /DNA_START=43 /DNA_END=717 /DNA_ORIENTATION=-